MESWDHELGERKVARVATTLVRRQGGRSWFEHRDGSGVRWTDSDGKSASDVWASGVGRAREQRVGAATLRLDGRPVACHVILSESSTSPFVAGHPVLEWVRRHKRWEAQDPKLGVRVLRVEDLGIETRYRDGRVQRSRGLWTENVRTLHDRVRVHGRSYDCWVVIRKVLTESGAFAERTTTWRYDGTPVGWVKRLTELRDPRTGAMTRKEQIVADFRYE